MDFKWVLHTGLNSNDKCVLKEMFKITTVGGIATLYILSKASTSGRCEGLVSSVAAFLHY